MHAKLYLVWDMFNKESCRNCGSALESIKTCSACNEITLWHCNKCHNSDESIHLHDFSNNVPNSIALLKSE